MKELVLVISLVACLIGCESEFEPTDPTELCLNHCRIWQYEYITYNGELPSEFCCDLCDDGEDHHDAWTCAMVNSHDGGSVWDCWE
jgi:hypothetical protein